MPSAAEVTSSSIPGGSDTVYLVPTEPFEVKPIIQDLLRTRFCVPGSVFLVEGVDRQIPIKKRYKAVRLLVSDGILCIQALLKGDAHGLVENGQIYTGCYVRVDSFELRFVELSDGTKHGVEDAKEGWTAAAGGKTQQKNEARTMVYLLLDNPVTVGWNTAYMNILDPQTPAPSAEVAVQAKELELNPGHHSGVELGNEDTLSVPAAIGKGPPDQAQSRAGASPRYGSITEPRSDSPDFLRPSEAQPQPNARSDKPPVMAAANVISSSEHLPWSSDDPTKPLKLTPLGQIPSLPYKQNWMVNVLAVVASLSDVEPSHLPPYHQRTARLADPSTSKQVLLTVFLDPDDFTPSVGSVVLILGVKNHRFDGGSLKKYASDRPKNGGKWWYEEPTELGWCDVARLKAWWDSKRAAG